VQSFNGSVKPLGETRPAWKVLRVLGNLLDLGGFDYDTSEAIRNEVLGGKTVAGVDLTSRLNNLAKLAPQAPRAHAGEGQPERIADVPIYFSDAIVRRADSLQKTQDAQAPKAWLSATLAQKLGVTNGAQVRVTQGQGSALLTAAIDAKLPANVVRVAAAHASTATLGAMHGSISVEKA
jgi:NADH-quinone oxidoreductase subunit G